MKKIYFISGHRDLKISEFKEHYVPVLEKAIQEEGSMFVLAECEGTDCFAQDWLAGELSDTDCFERVTVYHMLDKPRYLASSHFQTKGGFLGDIHRDAEMTKNSDVDIAFIRPGYWKSGTAQNILRRYERII